MLALEENKKCYETLKNIFPKLKHHQTHNYSRNQAKKIIKKYHKMALKKEKGTGSETGIKKTA